MAKATANCTCKQCGNKFIKTAIKTNRTSAAEWEKWAENYYDTCPDCEAAGRTEKAAELAKQAAADGMPALKGTEKQIIWAEQIRARMITEFENVRAQATVGMELMDEAQKAARVEELKLYDQAEDYILHHYERASWWIDKRDTHVLTLAAEVLPKMEITEAESTREAVEAKEKETIIPENHTHDVVEITVSDSDVSMRYPRDDTFRALVKAAGLQWDADRHVWHRAITQFTGSAVDRAAEIGNVLLCAGFGICCHDADVLRMARDGVFEPECKLWIKSIVRGEYTGWLSISIPNGDHYMYEKAKKLKGSRWNTASSSVVVPVANFELVRDFAELFGYRLSNGANESIAEYEKARANAVQPIVPKKEEKPDRLSDILLSEDAILDDLRDDG
jgi:hypothetical protein